MTAKLEPKLDANVWVDKHGDCLYALAYSRLRDSRVAENLLIETFSDAARIPLVSADRNAERKWLVGLLKSKILELLRNSLWSSELSSIDAAFTRLQYLFDDRNWEDHWTPELIPVEWRLTAETAASDNGFFETLNNCIEELPGHAAAAFTLREMDGMTGSAICDVLNIALDDYETLLGLARMHLRRCLEVNWFINRTTEDH